MFDAYVRAFGTNFTPGTFRKAGATRVFQSTFEAHISANPTLDCFKSALAEAEKAARAILNHATDGNWLYAYIDIEIIMPYCRKFKVTLEQI